MSDKNMTRPAVMETLTETQLSELEFQAGEYDREEFLEYGANYGWDKQTAEEVWRWFEVQNSYPLDSSES